MDTFTDAEREIAKERRHAELMEIMTALTNTMIDASGALQEIRNHLDKRWDPRDPDVW